MPEQQPPRTCSTCYQLTYEYPCHQCGKGKGHDPDPPYHIVTASGRKIELRASSVHDAIDEVERNRWDLPDQTLDIYDEHGVEVAVSVDLTW